jgi:hypothetical protein
MQHEDNFINLVKENFKIEARENYLPDQTYINRLIASLDKVEANNYSQSQTSFISEYKYLEGIGVSHSIKEFVNGCLNQLLWINSILESGKYAGTIEDLEEEFDYITPTMLDLWTLVKVTKKGVFFRGAEPFQDSHVTINSENIIEITIALSTVAQQCGEHIAAKKNEQDKSVVISDAKVNDSSLFISKELETKCLNVLKEITNPVLDINGQFMDEFGMKGAIVIWYDKCKLLGFTLKTFKNRVKVAEEVMKIIPGLSIDGSTFDVSSKSIKYKKDMEEKLSQLSHN